MDCEYRNWWMWGICVPNGTQPGHRQFLICGKSWATETDPYPGVPSGKWVHDSIFPVLHEQTTLVLENVAPAASDTFNRP